VSRLKEVDPEIFQAIQNELDRQEYGLELIPSENFVSEAVLTAQGSVLTNKYSEGYPGKRYYGGNEFCDVVERLAIDRVKKLFNAPHANVQPHSGSQANLAALLALAQPGETIMGMALDQGGHLTHGWPVNATAKIFKAVQYGVRPDTGLIDYDQVAALAQEHKPKVIIAGATAYSRIFDWPKFRVIADSVGAYFMADIAHIAGLIVAGIHPNPFPHAHVVTTTTHKTLRGPRAGVIMSQEDLASAVDKAIFPGTQGGPLMHIIAAKAVAFHEAMQPEFKEYQKNIVANSKALAKSLIAEGLAIVSGGTDNHMMIVDLRPIQMTGKRASTLLDSVHITVNKNTIPNDPEKPAITSGIRLGTPAITTRGMGVPEMAVIGKCIADKLKNPEDESVHNQILKSVADLCRKFPLYKDKLASVR
jgi:glycine hydroxymethyltransferase